jgi:sigma-B regulation protein RsbU (phosphoserine phosphatase)
MAVLITTRGPTRGKPYPISGGQCLLGRLPSCDIYDLFLESPRVSRQHSRITTENGQFYLDDLGSRNGTRLNGALIDARTPIHDGDRIQIGEFEFGFYTSNLTATNVTLEDIRGPTMPPASLVEDRQPSTILSRKPVNPSFKPASLAGVKVSADTKLQALVELLTNLSGSLETEPMLTGVLDGLFTIFARAERGFIGLIDKTGKIEPVAVKIRGEQALEQTLVNIAFSRTITDMVVQSKEALLSADAVQDERFDASKSVRQIDIHSIMCAPLLDAEEHVVGVIQLDATGRTHSFSPVDLELLASVAGPVAVAIRYGQLHEQSVKHRLLDYDLELARRIQYALLPEDAPELKGYRLFAHYDAAWQVGGDFYDYMPLPGGRVAIMLADAAGKGVSASLLAARMSGELRTCLSIEPSPSTAVERINESLATSGLAGRFITLVLAVVHPASHTIELVNAGHPPPLIRRRTGTVEEVGDEVCGIALGIVSNATYESTTVELAVGEHLVIYTDGFTEAENPTSELYGNQRLIAIVAAASSDAATAGQRIIDDVRESDDMCLVVLSRES